MWNPSTRLKQHEITQWTLILSHEVVKVNSYNYLFIYPAGIKPWDHQKAYYKNCVYRMFKKCLRMKKKTQAISWNPAHNAMLWSGLRWDSNRCPVSERAGKINYWEYRVSLKCLFRWQRNSPVTLARLLLCTRRYCSHDYTVIINPSPPYIVILNTS